MPVTCLHQMKTFHDNVSIDQVFFSRKETTWRRLLHRLGWISICFRRDRDSSHQWLLSWLIFNEQKKSFDLLTGKHTWHHHCDFSTTAVSEYETFTLWVFGKALSFEKNPKLKQLLGGISKPRDRGRSSRTGSRSSVRSTPSSSMPSSRPSRSVPESHRRRTDPLTSHTESWWHLKTG